MNEVNKPDEYKKYYSSLVWELRKKISDEYRKEGSTAGYYRADGYAMDLL